MALTHVYVLSFRHFWHTGYAAVARDDDVDAAEELVFTAVERGSGDNITAVVVRLSQSVPAAQVRGKPLRVASAI